MEGADALDVGFAVGDGVMSLAAVVVVVVVVVALVVVVAAASASEEVEEAMAGAPGTTHPASQAKTQLGSVPQRNVFTDPCNSHRYYGQK